MAGPAPASTPHRQIPSPCHLRQGGRAVRGGALAQRGGGDDRGALPAAGAGGGAGTIVARLWIQHEA